MAKYANSPLLSALTEGQDRSTLKLLHTKEATNPYSVANSSPAVEYALPTASSNCKLLSIKKNKRSKKGTSHNLRSTSLTTSRTGLKRLISSTDPSVLDSNIKKQRLSALNEHLIEESTFTSDCIAHRTRSKTLFLQERSISLEPISAKKESTKVQLQPDTFVRSHTSPKKNNLLNYYRETRNISRNYSKKGDANIIPKTSSTPTIKSKSKLKKVNINSTNKRNNTFNINFDSKKKQKYRQPNRNNKYNTPPPTSSNTIKSQNTSRKFIETRRSQQNKSSAIENNLEETVDKIGGTKMKKRAIKTTAFKPYLMTKPYF